MFTSFSETVKDFKEDLKSKVAEKEIKESDIEPELEQLRLKLLKNNVALETAERITQQVKKELIGTKVTRTKLGSKISEVFEKILAEELDQNFDFQEFLEETEQPVTIFMVGFNGSGKTTSTAKLGAYLKDKEFETVFGAADTFRAASIEQLKKFGDDMEVKVISHDYESDPAAVAYDTVEHADKEGKVALVDTAGRTHGDQNLMDELKKMFDVNEPDFSFLVVDALTGNDVLDQVDAYQGMFDAFIVTKTDVDDTGGVLLTLSEASEKPIGFLGTGQGLEDLEEFDSESVLEKFLD